MKKMLLILASIFITSITYGDILISNNQALINLNKGETRTIPVSLISYQGDVVKRIFISRGNSSQGAACVKEYIASEICTFDLTYTPESSRELKIYVFAESGRETSCVRYQVFDFEDDLSSNLQVKIDREEVFSGYRAFGSLDISSNVIERVHVRNLGKKDIFSLKPVSISNTRFAGGEANISIINDTCQGKSLKFRHLCTFDILYEPSSVFGGTYQIDITIDHLNDSAIPSITTMVGDLVTGYVDPDLPYKMISSRSISVEASPNFSNRSAVNRSLFFYNKKQASGGILGKQNGAENAPNYVGYTTFPFVQPTGFEQFRYNISMANQLGQVSVNSAVISDAIGWVEPVAGEPLEYTLSIDNSEANLEDRQIYVKYSTLIDSCVDNGGWVQHYMRQTNATLVDLPVVETARLRCIGETSRGLPQEGYFLVIQNDNTDYFTLNLLLSAYNHQNMLYDNYNTAGVNSGIHHTYSYADNAIYKNDLIRLDRRAFSTSGTTYFEARDVYYFKEDRITSVQTNPFSPGISGTINGTGSISQEYQISLDTDSSNINDFRNDVKNSGLTGSNFWEDTGSEDLRSADVGTSSDILLNRHSSEMYIVSKNIIDSCIAQNGIYRLSYFVMTGFRVVRHYCSKNSNGIIFGYKATVNSGFTDDTSIRNGWSEIQSELGILPFSVDTNFYNTVEEEVLYQKNDIESYLAL